MDHKENNNLKDSRIISPFSRIAALRDGVLIDVTEYAKEFGFKYPVAITYSVQRKLTKTFNMNESSENKFKEKLKNLLFGLCCTIFFLPKDPSIQGVTFSLGETYASLEFKAICGPDDDGNPVLTIMVEEDE